MAIVVRGLGQPEAGSLTLGGLGTSEQTEGAITAALVGSTTLTATLTATAAATSDAGGSDLLRWVPYTPPTPTRYRVPITATLTGAGALTGDLVGVFDFDGELEQLLLVGAI
jgi:hypothetical protein